MTRGGLHTSDYDFPLPRELIAQHPLEKRDESRLMVLDRATGRIAHHVFRDIADLIPTGDALVLNTTRVFRARLLGTRSSGAPAEILLLRRLDADRFEAMVSPGGKVRPGRVVHIAPGFDVEVLSITERRTRIVRLRVGLTGGDVKEAGDERVDAERVDAAVEAHGHVPLPPYIARDDTAADAARYQTVYAREPGSAAAPTAGLHVTPDLLDLLAARGVRRVDVLLHVGAGTFKPVEVEDPARHVMHEESYIITEGSAATLREVRARGGKVWAVGTTAARTLESAAGPRGDIAAGAADTRLFIRPPYRFRAVDKLITNFHLPRSTLIMLVAAFAGYELTMQAYREAVERGYRFFSYGDAMVIL